MKDVLSVNFPWLYGFVGSLLIAGAAYWKRALSLSGAAAAVPMGTLFFVFGGLPWYGTLLAFFISSSLLTAWGKSRKETAARLFEKTGRRDAGQVLANGGAALVFCLGHAVWPHSVWWNAFVGVMAAVTADTWATEIGTLSTKAPRSIVTWQKVAPGTSGGVTVLGLGASAAGSLFIGLTAGGLSWLSGMDFTGTWIDGAGNGLGNGGMGQAAPGMEPFVPRIFSHALIAGIGGLVGSLADSFIGAGWQRMHRCPVCRKEVEVPVHCGTPVPWVRGLPFMNNDAVNLLSSVLGGIVAAAAGCFLAEKTGGM